MRTNGRMREVQKVYKKEKTEKEKGEKERENIEEEK